MRQRSDLPTIPTPGTPGASDLVTHLLRDHGLGFFSDPPVRASRPDGQYDLHDLEADHTAQHATGSADHDHDWTGRRGR